MQRSHSFISIASRIDLHGNIKWITDLSNGIHAEYSSKKGWNIDADGNPIILIWISSLWRSKDSFKIVKLDIINGDILWEKHFGNEFSQARLSSFIIREDSTYLTITNHLDENYIGYMLISEFSPSYVSVPEANTELPSTSYLSAAYPNPFNNETRISYGLASDDKASVKVYDIAGRLVTTLVNAEMNAGNHNVVWNAEGFTTGVYFVKMESANFTETCKVVLMK